MAVDDGSPTGTATTLDLRPRLIWRCGLPILAPVCVGVALRDGGISTWVAACLLVVLAIQAHVQFVRVRDGLVFRRDLTGWGDALDMRRLADVELVRARFGNELVGHQMLSIIDSDRRRMEFSLRWWTNADALVALVARAVLAPDAPPTGPARWRVPLSVETSHRLADALGRRLTSRP